MIVDSPLDVYMDDLYLRLAGFRGLGDVVLKLEGLNLAGSIKLKSARAMIEDLERSAGVSPETHKIIESSSGSLGVALSLVCRVKGYAFTCVTDANVSPAAEGLMRAYGSEVVIVTERDSTGGFLGSRLAYIAERLRTDSSYTWPNQYANPANPRAHYHGTAREIHEQFVQAPPDFVFIGAGTTGTLVGCARYFAVHSPATRIVAVDTVGSVTFGHPPGPRFIPGLGTSQRPEIASTDNVSDLVTISEWETAEMCQAVLRRYGFLVGGSTGTVLAAIHQYGPHLPTDCSVVAVSPDFGDRYVTTVYDPAWVSSTLTHRRSVRSLPPTAARSGARRPAPVGAMVAGAGGR
jgi:2,3-diaminopropionate biosynthesis protein SbnA